MTKLWAVALALLAIAAAPDPIGNQTDKVLDRHQAMIAEVKDLIAARKPAEAGAIARQVVAETDARLAGERRQIYSGQSTQMLLANMMGAAADKQDAVDVGPPLGEALFYEGYALIELGHSDEAGALLGRAVRVSPHNPQYLCETGAWAAGRRDWAQANDLYRRCAEASGLADGEAARARFHSAARRGQGYVLIEQGKLDEAEALYRALLKADPADDASRNELRHIQEQRAKLGKAAI